MPFDEMLRKIFREETGDQTAVLPSFRDVERVAEHVAALANSRGGYLFFEPPLSPEDTHELETLLEEVERALEPPLAPLLMYFTDRERQRAVFLVPESMDKPHLVSGKLLIWRGGEPQPMNRSELEGLLLGSSRRESYDSLLRPDVPLDALDSALIKLFAERTGSAPLWLGQVLEEYGLMVSGKLTNAGVILFAREPEAFVYGTEIEVTVFKDLEKQEIDVSYSIKGPILKKIEILEDTVSTYLSKIIGQEEINCFKGALREIIVNAVSHRDYGFPAPTMVRLSPESLEIWNPGKLCGGLTPQDLEKLHAPYHRNPLLARILRRMEMVKYPGAGTNFILKSADECGLPRPTFTEVQGGFLLTLELFAGGLPEVEVNERQRLLLEYLRLHREITRKEYQEMVRVSERTARHDLEELVSRGLLKKSGKGKNTRYVLP